MDKKSVTVHGGGVTLTGEGITLFQLLTIARGLKLERLGMKLTRGPSCLSIAKKQFGFKGSREKVYAQVLAKIKEIQESEGITPEELDATIKGSSPF